MIWLPVMVILCSGAVLLAVAITAAIVHRPAIYMVCLGVAMLAVMAILSAWNLRKTTITGLILFPAIYLVIIGMVEPLWLQNPRFFGVVAAGLLFTDSLNILLRFDPVLTAVGFFSLAGILLVTAKMALLTETFGPAEVVALAVGSGFSGMTVLGWNGKKVEVRSSFAKCANRTFYPCLVLFGILGICSSHNFVTGAAIVVGVEFVTGLNELAGEGSKSRRAIAAGAVALALLVSMPGFRSPFERAATWILRPANWILAAAPTVWTAVVVRNCNL